jgi:hypothetical protein
MSDAPTELWADWDYDANDGVCGVHTHKKYASGYEPDCPPIRYVRADRIEELDAKLAQAEDFVLRTIRYAGNNGDDFLADKARAALAELKGENQ